MFKKLLIPIFIFLFVISVSAQDIGDPCLNNNDCDSGICQGGLCRTADIILLLLTQQQGCLSTPSICIGLTDICDPATDTCVECIDDDDYCEDKDDDYPFCVNKKCVQCEENDDCEDIDDDYPYCNVHKECVECLEDSDCSSGYECDSYECEEESYDSGNGDSGNDYYGSPCYEDWVCTTWSACIGGKKTHTCTDKNDCGTENYKPAESFSCTLGASATCNDGMKNQGEDSVDCGGPCAPCNSCYDNEQNCHGVDCEEGIDCGGPCIPCKHALPIMLIIITAIIVIILLILGVWYWSLKKTGATAGRAISEFRPPMQPSSRLKI